MEKNSNLKELDYTNKQSKANQDAQNTNLTEAEILNKKRSRAKSNEQPNKNIHNNKNNCNNNKGKLILSLI